MLVFLNIFLITLVEEIEAGANIFRTGEVVDDGYTATLGGKYFIFSEENGDGRVWGCTIMTKSILGWV